MSVSIKYLGEDTTVKAASLNPQNVNDWPEISLKKDTYYDIDINVDGPIMIVNGQQVIDPNSTMWVVLSEGRIPYAPDLIKNFWDVSF